MIEFNPKSTTQLSTLFFGGTVTEKEKIPDRDELGNHQKIKSGKNKGTLKYKTIEVERKIKGLGLKPLKSLETKKEGVYQTNEAVLSLIAKKENTDAGKIASLMLRSRYLRKQISTYYNSTEEVIHDFDQCVHHEINHFGYSKDDNSVGGGVECLPASEIVQTNRGYRFITEVKEGDFVISHTGLSRRVIRTVINGVQPIIEVELETGLVLKTTKNHMYYTTTGWISAEELSINDVVYTTSKKEEFKRIVGWEDYKISSFGRVLNYKTGKFLSTQIKNKWGHLKVTLNRNSRLRKLGDKKDFSVARLVAFAFCSGYEDGLEVRHLNGIAWDNRKENLCWGTSKENKQDAVYHGTMQESHKKYSDEVINYIRNSSLGSKKLSKITGINDRYIRELRAQDVRKDYVKVEKKVEFFTSKIKRITNLDSRMTYGLTVEIDHSHVTNGIVTHNTGRPSGRNPNLLNQPKASDSVVKQHFIPRNGLWVSADFSQIEPCAQAEMSRDPKLVDDIKNGRDEHVKYLALKEHMSYDEVYDLCKIKKLQEWDFKRSKIKAFTFKRKYGGGAKSISEATGLTIDEVKEIFRAEEQAYPTLIQYQKRNLKIVEATGELQTIFGRVLKFKKYPAPSWKQEQGIMEDYKSTQVINYPVQSVGSADLTLIMIGHFWRTKAIYNRDKYLMINTVYDSLDLDCKPEYEEELKEDLKCLTDVKKVVYNYFKYRWIVPVKIDIKTGKSWHEVGL